jgi:hypothetical protein
MTIGVFVILVASSVSFVWAPQQEWHVTYHADGSTTAEGPHGAIFHAWIWNQPGIWDRCIRSSGTYEIFREYRVDRTRVALVQLGILLLGGGMLTWFARRARRARASAAG